MQAPLAGSRPLLAPVLMFPGMRSRNRAGQAIVATFLIACVLLAQAAEVDLSSPAGLWEPLDSKGHPQGRIRIFKRGDAWFGRIEPSSPADDPNGRCTACRDERRNQPIIGLVLMRNLRFADGEYTGGDILDPDTGRVYGCKFRLIEGGRQLLMRGFYGVSLLGRSQVWRRVPEP